MKDTIQQLKTLTGYAIIFLFLIASGSIGNSQEPFGSGKEPVSSGKETVEYSSGLLPRKAQLRRLTKIDIDGDMNYDGVIDNGDPADNGKQQTTPPGLQVGVEELSKMVLRFKAYDPDYEGELTLRLELSGINREEPSGRFSSLAEENNSTGRVRVWKDAKKSVLLLDSSDANKRVFEWIGDREKIRTGGPGGFPRTVYVEGVGISNKHDGDLRLLLMSVYKPESSKKEPYIDAVDHILVTVRSKAIKKDFVNNNAEAVWVTK